MNVLLFPRSDIQMIKSCFPPASAVWKSVVTFTLRQEYECFCIACLVLRVVHYLFKVLLETVFENWWERTQLWFLFINRYWNCQISQMSDGEWWPRVWIVCGRLFLCLAMSVLRVILDEGWRLVECKFLLPEQHGSALGGDGQWSLFPRLLRGFPDLIKSTDVSAFIRAEQATRNRSTDMQPFSFQSQLPSEPKKALHCVAILSK